MSDLTSGVPSTPDEGWTDDLTLQPFFNEGLSGEKGQLKPIPTCYAGCLFRSRLEGKWAVFFDTLEIEWRYETEGFILAPLGERYLPDFYLPELGVWLEIKPRYPDAEAQRKACLFNCGLATSDDPVTSRERVYIVHGDIPWPYPKRGHIIGYATDWKDGENPAKEDLCWQICPVCDQLIIGQINRMNCQDCREELITLLGDVLEESVPGLPEFDRVIDIVLRMVSAGVNTYFFRSGHKNPALQEAYAAARSARFEGRKYHHST